MAQLVLTIVGDDRPGLVQMLADVVASEGGNWERSELTELAGVFAGVVQISVPEARRDAMLGALRALPDLRVTVHGRSGPAPREPGEAAPLSFTVLGNDRPGIVREITGVLEGHGLSIDRFTSRTMDAPMAGGTLFEASVSVRIPASADVTAVTRALERLAGEIQVDLSVDG